MKDKLRAIVNEMYANEMEPFYLVNDLHNVFMKYYLSDGDMFDPAEGHTSDNDKNVITLTHYDKLRDVVAKLIASSEGRPLELSEKIKGLLSTALTKHLINETGLWEKIKGERGVI